ncbi:patatin-like phospholipase family protein [Falsiroseomonas oryziterrae]|uniref:patatin-like phospholipase family protein n=1 Tax=Falsiroseomonas oryziterrae TaxID=2911368 RepID=UPI001F01E1CC|nr:patatin-like phospholipase family protein [Roseomonas sp. NPKOSM-4]
MLRLGLLVLALVLAGCASIVRLPPPPPMEVEGLRILDVPDARFWGDGDPAPLRRYLAQVLERREEDAPRPGGARLPPTHFLALSGGADDGAFGAGILAGWTESGTRPSFSLVTGISAGALIAPFAFLGPAYDDRLRELFTEIAPADVLRLGRIAVALLFREAIADTSPLAQLIGRHADEAMLAAIAAEHARGRLLLIGTVNLDVGRPVIWNIGAIASSGHPRALELFRSILLASASIPGAFPPVLIEVEHGGRRFEEMHVDGGAAMQVFLYPQGLVPREAWARAGLVRERTAWVIRNGRIDVVAADGPRGIFSIATRSARTLLHFSGVNDVNAIYLTALRDGVAFRLQAIGGDFQAPRPEPFDTSYMQALFEHGRARGRDPGSWRNAPPPVTLLAPAPP